MCCCKHAKAFKRNPAQRRNSLRGWRASGGSITRTHVIVTCHRQLLDFNDLFWQKVKKRASVTGHRCSSCLLLACLFLLAACCLLLAACCFAQFLQL